MKRTLALTLTAGMLLFLGAATAQAGFKLKDADGNEKIDLGFRLQVLAIFSDPDNGDSVDDFRIRRARFRLKGTVNEHFGMFFQTDVSGNDIQMIDAYIHLKKDNRLQLFAGQHLAPSNRQNITSSGTLLAADRPGIIYKTLTWGTRVVGGLATATQGDTDLGIRGSAQVRDTGLTLFGVNSSGNTHFKYHLGYYDGISAPGRDSERTTGRIQLNFGDPEPSFYSVATYLGKKDTIAIGASYDTQSNAGGVFRDTTINTDYAYYSVDFFADKPMGGGGALTFEAAYSDLDLDGIAPRVEGDGYYVQGGYYKNKWQPWFLYEEWNSNDPAGRGSLDSWRVGISYFMQGHNANFKLGYEDLDVVTATGHRGLGSILLGFYTTY